MKEKVTTITEKFDEKGNLIEKTTIISEKEEINSQPYIIPWKQPFDTGHYYPWNQPVITYCGDGCKTYGECNSKSLADDIHTLLKTSKTY